MLLLKFLTDKAFTIKSTIFVIWEILNKIFLLKYHLMKTK